MSDNVPTGVDCSEEAAADEEPTTLCDGDRSHNVWIDGGDRALGNGACQLDTMTEDQVVYTIQRNE